MNRRRGDGEAPLAEIEEFGWRAATIDGGASVGFDNCYVVPIASASAFVS